MKPVHVHWTYFCNWAVLPCFLILQRKVTALRKDRKLEVEALLHFTQCAVNAKSLLTLSGGKDKRKIALSGLL